jgi:serine/threonine protein kinase
MTTRGGTGGAAGGEGPSDPGGANTPTVDRVIADYLEAVDAGTAPDPAEVVAAHPGHAEELRQFFADRSHLAGWAGPASRWATGEETTPLPPRPAARRASAGVPPPPAESGPPPATETPAADGRFGEYDLLGELGRGGMGVVYRARHRGVGRTVALKMILAGRFASPDAVRAFRRGMRANARLDHPNVVPVYEVGAHDGLPYFTMPLVEGGSLADPAALARFRDRPKAAAATVATLARAIHHAHQRGFIHRDLKPANVLLDAAGEPHVADFGLARSLGRGAVAGDDGAGEGGGGDRDETLTAPGEVVGTLAYMAPDQLRGGRAVTVAADVYGLGGVLYAVLTGRPPFRGTSATGLMRAVMEDDPPPPAASNPAVGRDLQAVCLKCLEKDPDRRYPSALALAEDLDRYARDEPVSASPPTRAARARRFARRHRGLVVATSAVVLALAAGLSAATVGLLRARAERSKAELVYGVLRDVAPVAGRNPSVVDVMRVERTFLERPLSKEPDVQAPVRAALAAAYGAVGARADAARHRREVVRLLAGPAGGSPADVARAEAELAATLRADGRPAEALALEAAAWRRLPAAGPAHVSAGGPDRLMLAARLARADEAVRRTGSPDAGLLAERGVLLARAGRFADAAADHERAAALDPDYPWWRFYAAMLRLHQGDAASHAAHCRELATRLGANRGDPWAAERTAKACFATEVPPVPPEMLGGVRAAVDAALADAGGGAGGLEVAWLRIARGMGRYRGGQFREAASDLEAGRDALWRDAGGGQAAAVAAADFYLAMARHRRDEPGPAAEAMSRGADLMARHVPPWDADDLGDGIENWVLAHRAWAEATRVLSKPAPATNPSPRDRRGTSRGI